MPQPLERYKTYDDDESAGVPGCARAADPASEEVDLEKKRERSHRK